MVIKTLLLLGGYGNAGRWLARLLLQETDVRLVLAGRNGEQAQRVAARFNDQFAGDRVTGICVDAANGEDLQQVLAGMDLVIVASSTARHAREVAVAALAKGADYLDIQYSHQKVAVLKEMAGAIARAGRCFITDAGFHPGLPAALVRYAGRCFDRLETAMVAGLFRQDWNLPLAENTIEEFLEEISDYRADVWKGGRWQKVNPWNPSAFPPVDFGSTFGRRYCAPLALEEMYALPEMFPFLKETGFYMAGFNWFVDWLVLPLALIAARLRPKGGIKRLGPLLHWGLKTFSPPPFGVVLKVEAGGQKNGQAQHMVMSLHHEDGYAFTAIPVVACLLQYLDGSACRPGLWPMGHLVDPDRLLKDMEKMGIRMRIQTVIGAVQP